MEDRQLSSKRTARALILVMLASLPSSLIHAQNQPNGGPAPGGAQSANQPVVELRSSTGSSHFRVGEPIPLELMFSSDVPGKFLQPCMSLRRSCFGIPVCRFANHWSFSITPEQGWIDLDRPCDNFGGPMGIVEDHDLSATPRPTFNPRELTGLNVNKFFKHHSVRVNSEIELHIAGAPLK